MKNLSIKYKMLIYAIIAVVIITGMWLLQLYFSSKIEIKSPIYTEIMLSNELIADILPPPGFVVETYALSLEYANSMTPDDKREAITSRIEELHTTYEARHEYWLTNLPTFEDLQTTFLEEAYSSGEKVFDVFYNEIKPAIDYFNLNAISGSIEHLVIAYDDHKVVIDKVVTLSQRYIDEVMLKSVEEAADLKNIVMIAIVIGAVLLIVSVAIVISLPIIASTKYSMLLVNGIYDGHLDQRVDKKWFTKDETGQLCYTLNKFILRLEGYINEINVNLRKMGVGDLNIVFNEMYAGQFGYIRSGFEDFADDLSDILSKVGDGAAEVNMGAQSITTISTMLASGSNTQSGEILELGSAIRAVSNRSEDTMKLSANASAMAYDTKMDAEAGSVQMQNMLNAVKEIKDASSNIGVIIKTIDDIAFKTNILALNAAVEASRAGRAGKGFAVVAQEVRSLAEQSAEAAESTKKLVEESLKKTELGTKISIETSEKLNEIVQKVIRSTEIVNNITAINNEQGNAVIEINKMISDVTEVITQNNAVAEEASATASELSGQAELLDKAVKRFKLRGYIEEVEGAENSVVDGFDPLVEDKLAKNIDIS